MRNEIAKIKHQRYTLGQRYTPMLVRDGTTGIISARCVYCGTHKFTVKDGFIYKKYGRRKKIPRWKCNACDGRTFTLINEELL